MRWSFFCLLVGSSQGYFYQSHNVTHPLRCPVENRKWSDLYDATQTSIALIQRRQFLDARRYMSDAISLAMTNLTEAFDCSIGISSSFRILALSFAADNDLEAMSARAFRRANQIALRLLHVGMNWLTHAFVIKGENDFHWIDESIWPLSIQEMNDEQHAIQHQITKSGPYGHAPTWVDCPYDYRDPKLSIAIVTMCDYPPEHVLPKYSLSNKDIYANKWGYPVIAVNKRFDDKRPHAWAKISLLEKIASEKKYDWLLWFDCDTYFMNLNVTLDHVLFSFAGIPNCEKTNSCHLLDPSVHLILQEDHAMLNTGVFFIRSSDWGISMLRQFYGPNDSPWIDHPWWENAAMSHALLGGNHKKFRNEDLLEFSKSDKSDMENIYGPHVRVAPQVVFNSYHPVTSRIFQHDTWSPGKFVLAFSGVTSGSSPTVAQHIYGEYYRQMCQINNVQHLCIPVQELPIHPWSN